MGTIIIDSEGKFRRVLGSKDVLALAFGAMIGWGWVVLTGGWVIAAGSAGAMIAFAIGGAVVILIGLTYAELASAMPLTGGEHVYSHRALGMGASFFCTWAIILGYVSVVAFEAVALPTVIEHLFVGMNRVCGLALWVFADFRSSESAGRILGRPRGYNNKGVVDEYRRPKQAFEVVRRWFSRLA